MVGSPHNRTLDVQPPEKISVSREHRALVAGWIVGAMGILVTIGWAASWNAYLNLMLTFGTINCAIVAWIATNKQ